MTGKRRVGNERDGYHYEIDKPGRALVSVRRWMNYPEEMVAEPNGPYVLYEDHLAAVEEARRAAFRSGVLSGMREVDAALTWEIEHGRKSVYDLRSWFTERWKSARAEGKP